MIVELAHVFGPPPAGGSWFDADDVTILTALDILRVEADAARGDD
jgi:hypothetical protein